MRICHVTAHLPPDQGANALLPVHLGRWARDAGDEPSFISHPPRAMGPTTSGALADVRRAMPGPVTWIEPRGRGRRFPVVAELLSLIEVERIRRETRASLGSADIVHVHSNGLLPEAVGLLATRMGKPVVLTLYGTEVWHYAPRRCGTGLFTRVYRKATHVTFYSRGLLDRAMELGLARDHISVVYPPVADYFSRRDDGARQAARTALGLREANILLNVKRLHPLAGQHRLVDAMPAVLRAYPDTRLVICGTGSLRDELQARAADLGVAGQMTLTGLVDNRTVAQYQVAADLFVLPSELEALPTVAIEALATGTPVVSTDNPGGVELGRLFGDDVRIVPRVKPEALAAAIVDFLSNVRRTCARTDGTLHDEFRPPAVAARYWDIYRRATSTGRP